MDFRARKGFKRKATLQAAHIMATNYTKSINSVFRQFLRIYARHVGKGPVIMFLVIPKKCSRQYAYINKYVYPGLEVFCLI